MDFYLRAHTTKQYQGLLNLPSKQILRLFADHPSAPLSIQNIATTGKDMDISVGQWFGPTTISHVMRWVLIAVVAVYPHSLSLPPTLVFIGQLTKQVEGKQPPLQLEPTA